MDDIYHSGDKFLSCFYLQFYEKYRFDLLDDFYKRLDDNKNKKKRGDPKNKAYAVFVRLYKAAPKVETPCCVTFCSITLVFYG